MEPKRVSSVNGVYRGGHFSVSKVERVRCGGLVDRALNYVSSGVGFRL